MKTAPDTPPVPGAGDQLDDQVGAGPDREGWRYAHYEGADELPRVAPELWWRLVQLLVSRGEHLHPCAYRLAKDLQLRHADKRGLVTDIDEVLARYAATHGLSKRVGWTDLGRLMEAGLVRQVHAAAPERKACYALAMDLAALPDDLPKTLADALRRHIDNPITIAKGGQTKAAIDDGLSECEVVRYGSASRAGVAREPIMTALGCGRLHTSPYTREGLPPPQSHPSQGSRPSRRRPVFAGRDFNEERGAALNFVKGLCPDWALQRGGVVPSDAELAELAHLVMLLLRQMPESEARELLTTQVTTAADLAGVLRWRIGRALAQQRRAARRAAQLRVDDDGSRHQAWLQANDAANAANAARKAELVELARRLARRAAEPRLDLEQARLEARTTPAETKRPSGAPSGPRPPSQDDGVSGRVIASPGPLRGATEPELIFRANALGCHRLPGGINAAARPEPGSTTGGDPGGGRGVTGDSTPDSVAAERAWLVQMMADRMRRPADEMEEQTS